MEFKRILLDTNVCLDAMLDIGDFAADALHILDLSEQKVIEGVISAHCVDTLFYILNQVTSKDSNYNAINALRSIVQIAPVDSRVIDSALSSEWSDLEDSITYHAAQNANCEAIITRNPKDFKNSVIPILSPFEFLEELEK